VHLQILRALLLHRRFQNDADGKVESASNMMISRTTVAAAPK
jgi:hypothetical protein